MQLNHESFSRLPADSWNRCQPGKIIRSDRRNQFVSAHPREECDSQLGPNATDGNDLQKQFALANGFEPEELQRVFTNMRVNPQLHRLSSVFKIIKCREW